MAQPQSYGSDRRSREQNKKWPGLQLDAQTLQKLKEQALRKAKLLQLKVSIAALAAPSELPGAQESAEKLEICKKADCWELCRLQELHQRTWTKLSLQHMTLLAPEMHTKQAARSGHCGSMQRGAPLSQPWHACL